MIKGIRPQLAEGGKIKIGGLGQERRTGEGKVYRLPVKYDHFVLTLPGKKNKNDDLEQDTKLMSQIETDRDGHIREIPIIVHSDEIEEVFPTANALYTGRRLACRGDGEAATRHEISDGKRTGRSKEMPCPCDLLNAPTGPICKPHGTFHCSIAVAGCAVAGAVHMWRTTSIISIERMIGSLIQIRQVCGTLRGIPLWMRVEPVHVETGVVYCCHLELRAADIQELQLKAMRVAEMRRALSTGDSNAYRALIVPPAGDSETIEEQDEIAQEFHPEIADPKDVIELPPGVHAFGRKKRQEQVSVVEQTASQPETDLAIEGALASIDAATTHEELDRIAVTMQEASIDKNQIREAWRARSLAIKSAAKKPVATDDPGPHDYGPPAMTDEQAEELGW